MTKINLKELFVFLESKQRFLPIKAIKFIGYGGFNWITIEIDGYGEVQVDEDLVITWNNNRIDFPTLTQITFIHSVMLKIELWIKDYLQTIQNDLSRVRRGIYVD